MTDLANDKAMEFLRLMNSEIESHNPLRKGHADRVSSYAVATAFEMGWRGGELLNLRFAAGLHEIGKLSISCELLESPHALSEKELELIRSSCCNEAKTRLQRRPLDEEVTKIICGQYDWFNAAFRNQKTTMQTIGSCILLVCIAFDVMTTDQPWKHKKTEQEAIDELKEFSGTQFDPEVVNAFLRIQPIIQPVIL